MQMNQVRGMEINAKMVGALFTERVGARLDVFCLYLNGDAIRFDLPIDENVEGVDHLFKQLDMLDKCNSAIVDQLVRARVYIQDAKGIWMYTLLATEGSVAPQIDETIHTLPWKRLWTARGTEILKLQRRRGYCYAVRSKMVEDQLLNTLRQAKGLIHPAMPQQRRRHAGQVVGAVVAGVVMLFAMGLGYHHFKKTDAGKPVQVQARALTPETNAPAAAAVPTTNYFLMANREINGPFPLEEILKRKASGQLPTDALVREENSVDWQKIDVFVKAEKKK